MMDLNPKVPLLPSRKATMALSIISRDNTVEGIATETGATALEVEQWVRVIRECSQELFCRSWGEKRGKADVLYEEHLCVILRELNRLHVKMDSIVSAAQQPHATSE